MKYENWHTFFRNDFACAIYYEEDSYKYYGYIGFPHTHAFYNTAFQKINNICLYKYELSFPESTLNQRWWMGFEDTSYHKVLEKIKIISDICSGTP